MSDRHLDAARAVLHGDDLVVLCAANNWDSMFVADQHIATQLARSVPVLYVDPPLSLLTPLRRPDLRGSVEGPRVRALGPNLVRLTPLVVPGPERRGLTSLATAMVRRSLRTTADALGLRARVLLNAWPLRAVEGACGEGVTVFWAQDDFAGGAELFGLDGDRLGRGEAARAARADLVIAANPGVAERWAAAGRRVELIPYGCDAERFARVDAEPPAADVRLAGPIAGVVGQFNARTDLSLLEAVAERGRSLLLVGPVDEAWEPERFARLTERPNVQWTGRRPFEAVGSYLRLIDVGLVPYADTAFNRGSFPLKTLEYLAAGRRVVATDLPAIRSLGTDLVAVAGGPERFADAVDAAAAVAPDGEERAARQAFAEARSWERRAAEIARVTGLRRAGPLQAGAAAAA